MNVITFDTETTGVNPSRDQVIEVCIKLGVEEDAASKTWRIRPSVPISEEARKVHGISIDDLEYAPSFMSVADEIRELFEWADVLTGYNVRFDLEMLKAEYVRLDQEFPYDNEKIIMDAYKLWLQMSPRSLQNAYEKFVNDEGFKNAHSAEADVNATAHVIRNMMQYYGVSDWKQAAEICEPDRKIWIGPSHHFQWKDGVPVFGFGKHSGEPLWDHPGYLNWIASKDFPRHVRRICREASNRSSESLLDWLRGYQGE